MDDKLPARLFLQGKDK